jgi:GT2 family glycosyltransferase
LLIIRPAPNSRNLMDRTKIVELELSRPLAPLAGLHGYASVLALVRLDGEPLGYARSPIADGRCHLESLLDNFLARHERELVRALSRRWTALPPLARAPFTVENLPALARRRNARVQRGRAPPVSVAVCTRDRARDLERCLDALLLLDPAPLEIVVVDNAPATNETRELVSNRFGDAVRYVLEPRPGLDWARNRAVLETRGEIVAFTDDDVLVDPGWAGVIADTFASAAGVMALTGLVVPAELESEPQHHFERYGGFGRGFARRWYRRSQSADLRGPVPQGAGAYGTGANMAFRRSLFASIGGFAPELDVGTATNGGGDLEFFFRVLREGFALVYEPRAVVWHRHRRTKDALLEQLRGWGTGFWAYMRYSRQRYPDEAAAFRSFGRWWYRSFIGGARLGRAAVTHIPGEAPRAMALAELRGSFAARTALKQARRQAEAAARAFPDEPSLPPTSPARPDADRDRVLRAMHQSRTAVRSVDIGAPLKGLSGLSGYSAAELYFTRDGAPVGHALAAVEEDGVSAAQLGDLAAEYLWRELHRVEKDRVSSALRGWLRDIAGDAERGAPRRGAAETVSVVIATHDRPDELRGCLRAMDAQRTRHRLEVIVVDNQPASRITRGVVAEFPFARYVAEARAGLSYARNSGVRAARGAIVACTDDDARPAPNWLERVVAPFARPDVMVVTGNVLPLELESEAQQLFERWYGGLGRGFRAREFGPEWLHSFRRAVRTWEIGATANAAIRASAFRHPAIGFFDEALGAGTPAPVGEDTYLFYRVLAAGFRIVYEPAAVVWHRHRREMAELRAQVFGYSAGHVAYNLTTWRRDGDGRGLLRVCAELPVHDLKLLALAAAGRAPYPLDIVFSEVAGHLAGPLAYWRAVRRADRLGRGTAPGTTEPDIRDRERTIPLVDDRECVDGVESARAGMGALRRSAGPDLGG